MRKQRKSVRVLAIVMTFIGLLVVMPCLTMAGDLNPPASPASTMHTLDEIYDRTPSISLPRPEDVTIINKSHTSSSVNWETIHTVSTGKTFYLMGIKISHSSHEASVSLDGGSTNHFRFGGTEDIERTINSSYPIATISEGTEIKGRYSIIDRTITIWGYEKTNN